jgi:hypothetical protein
MFNPKRARSWTLEQLKLSVQNSTSRRQVLQRLGLREAGGNYDQLKKYIKELGLDTRHFTGMTWNKGLTGIGKPIIPLKEILVKNSQFQSYKLKNRLFTSGIKSKKCELCGWDKKSIDDYLPLELHHKNGDRHDNRIVNLIILCPNCHSLQSNYRGRNKIKKI